MFDLNICVEIQTEDDFNKVRQLMDNWRRQFPMFKHDVNRIENIIETHKKRGSDPSVPIGDNCKGYVAGFKYLQQGYDKDKN